MSTPTVVAGGPLPSLVRRGPAPYAGGYGLFTTRAVKAGEVVLHLTDPLVVVPDDKHLGECCSGCMLWRPPPPLAQKQEQEQEPRYPDPEVEGLDQDLKLVRCAWCTVVWYCGKVGRRGRGVYVCMLPCSKADRADAICVCWWGALEL